jgi:hypothetical protein
MPQGDNLTVVVVGAAFAVLGIVAYFWGRREEKTYLYAMAKRRDDLREFVSHWPPRAAPGAVKVGGWIAISIGGILMIVGFLANL